MKDYLFDGVVTIKYVSDQIVVIVTMTKDFRIWVFDTTLEYLQSDEPS